MNQERIRLGTYFECRIASKMLGLGSSIVPMVQSAEPLVRKNVTRSQGARSTARRFLLQSQVRAVFMIVTDIVGEQPIEMSFTAMMWSNRSRRQL